MEKVHIPEGYQQVMPYLILPQAEKFLEFVKNVFGATEKMLHPGEDGRGIMHGEVRIGQSVIMFADGSEQWKPCTAGLYVYVENSDETYRKALEAGAESLMEVSDQSYGRSGGVRDPFGNTWWIVTDRAAG